MDVEEPFPDAETVVEEGAVLGLVDDLAAAWEDDAVVLSIDVVEGRGVAEADCIDVACAKGATAGGDIDTIQGKCIGRL